ncbi:biliverdin-producing heme oxygenase [Thiorhodovibrio winogradskyi]|nr:biliverdin-producing heme oxygenase [Thiorhodovibrio winogradskyi]
MQALRARTAALHAATEALPLMRDLMAPEVDADIYRAYLGALARPYRLLEPHLHASCAPLTLERMGVRERLPALERDLEALGDEPMPPPPADAEHLSSLVANQAQALGGLYVLEGATLGGRVISQRLRQNLGAEADRLPFHFLGTREDRSPAEGWRRFGAALEDEVSTRGHDPEQVLTAAVAVFGLVHRHLGGNS